MTLRSIVSFLTFPGVVIHELAHKLYCDYTGTPVYKVRYLTFGNPMGYVIHGEPRTLSAAFAISVGPLIINTLVAVLLPLAVILIDLQPWQAGIVIWLAFSSGFHAFPSNIDAESFLAQVRRQKGRISFFFIFSWGFSLVIRLANALKYLWFDGIYAAAAAGLALFYFGYIEIPLS
jgi:hypothetical protein